MFGNVAGMFQPFWPPIGLQVVTFAVLVVGEGGVARRRAVQTGAVSADRAEIVRGLAAGEKVIVRGGFTVKDGDRVRNGGGA